MNYLKALIGDERTDLLFVGYQAQGTLGRKMVDGARAVTNNGEHIPVKAQVHLIGRYSAHADQKDLVRFALRVVKPPREIRIVHGDEEAKLGLREKLQSALPGARVWIPKG